jgi:hypothetical protein
MLEFEQIFELNTLANEHQQYHLRQVNLDIHLLTFT